MFALKEMKTLLSSVTPLSEKHGDERKAAVSLKLQVVVANAVLDNFAKGLKEAFFRKAVKDENFQIFEGADALVALKFPLLGAVPIEGDWPGYEMELMLGQDPEDSIPLVDCTVKKINFECMEGGSVIITFSVHCHPEPAETGELCTKIQQDITVSLIPPTEQTD